MDKSLATLLRSLQSSPSLDDALRLLPSATTLLSSLNNPLNLTLIASQLLSAPALWAQPTGLSQSRQIFSAFYTAASHVTSSTDQDVFLSLRNPLNKILVEDWVRAVVRGADDKSPRWRHAILLGGLLLGFGGREAQKTPRPLYGKLESALVRAVNLAIGPETNHEPSSSLSIAFVLNHSFPLLSNSEAARLNYDELLPLLIDAEFMSSEGLEQGYFLSVVDRDVREISGKLQWPSDSPSCNHLRALQAKPLITALGPLSRLAAHTVDCASVPILVSRAMDRILDFSRTMCLQWRQIKLSEIDTSEEGVYLDEETLQTSLPILWRALRSSFFAATIVMRAILGRVINDPRLAMGNLAFQIAGQALHTLRNFYFISTRFGQTSSPQYNFVMYTAIDILTTDPPEAQNFLTAIRPTELGQIPIHPLDRCLDLYFLNTAEHFTLILPPQVNEELLLATALPYLPAGGNNSQLEIFEAAHSLTLSVFSAPQDTELTIRQLPFYIDTLFKVFPTNLSARQFRFAFRTLLSVTSSPSPVARQQPMLASILLQMLFDRAWDAPSSLLPSLSLSPEVMSGQQLSEQAALTLALLDALPYVYVDVLEEWLPLAATLINRISDHQMRRICQERFWEMLSSGQMDVQRATTAVSWWTSRGGREMVLFGDAPHEDGYTMSGALESNTKL